MSKKQFVGIDVSKAKLDIAVYPEESAWTVANQAGEIGVLVERLSKLRPRLIVLEATGGYEQGVLLALSQAGLPVVKVNPRQVRQFAQAIGRLAKTDRIDAKVLALYACRVQPPVRALPDEATRYLDGLVVRRRQLVDMAKQEQLRLKQQARFTEEIQAHLSFLKQQIAGVEKEIGVWLKQHIALAQRAQLLEAEAGVGPVLSATLIGQLPELGRLTGKEVAALVGVAPLNWESGQFKGRRITWGGRAEVRSVLYMATLRAIKVNERIKIFYQRLLQAGKPKKLAVVACMRKLLVILNAKLRDGLAAA